MKFGDCFFFSFMFCILVTEGQSLARIHIYKITNVKHSGPAAEKRVVWDQIYISERSGDCVNTHVDKSDLKFHIHTLFSDMYIAVQDLEYTCTSPSND